MTLRRGGERLTGMDFFQVRRKIERNESPEITPDCDSTSERTRLDYLVNQISKLIFSSINA